MVMALMVVVVLVMVIALMVVVMLVMVIALMVWLFWSCWWH